MNHITAQQLITAIPATIRDIENWIARLDLGTKYHQPDRGHPRMFTKFNAIELAIIAACVRGGAQPSKALAVSRSFIPAVKSGRGADRRWLVFPAGDLSRGVRTDTIDMSVLLDDLKSTTLSVIDLHKLFAGVDQLFAEAA